MKCFRVVCDREVPLSARPRGKKRKFCSPACRRKADTEARQRGMAAMQRANGQRRRQVPAPKTPSYVTAMLRATMRLRQRYLRDLKKEQAAAQAATFTAEAGQPVPA